MSLDRHVASLLAMTVEAGAAGGTSLIESAEFRFELVRWLWVAASLRSSQ